MAIALKLDATTGELQRLAVADALEAAALEPRVTTTNLVIGATLTGAAKVVLGAAAQEVQIIGALEADTFIEFTDISAPGAPGAGLGRLYTKAGIGLFWHPNGGSEVDLTAGGGSLQDAYEVLNTIAITTAEGSLALSNTADATTPLTVSVGAFASTGIAVDNVAANTGNGIFIDHNATAADANGLVIDTDAAATGHALEIIHNGVAGAAGGGAIDVTLTASATGHGLHVHQDATDSSTSAVQVDMASGADGQGIQIVHAGSSATGDLFRAANSTDDLLRLGADGSAEFKGNSDGDILITTEGSGTLTLAAVGTGDLSLVVATGDLILNAAGEVKLSQAGAITRVIGDLVVDGTTTTVDSETVLIADNHIYLNAGYTTAAAQTGGIVVNNDPTATTDTVNGAYVAGVPATSNPTVGTVGAATYSVGDIIQFSDASDDKNEGLYEVLSHAANVLTIRGIGTTSRVEDFTQNQFEAVASNGATIVQTSVAVWRAGTDGIFESGSGSVTPITFTDVVSGAGDLQSSYDNGPAILIDANGPLAISNATTSDDLASYIRTFVGAGRAVVIDMGPGNEAVTGVGLDVSNGTGATGDLVLIVNEGTGKAFEVQDGAANPVFTINADGSLELQPTSGVGLDMATFGAGGIISMDAAGDDITFAALGGALTAFNQSADLVLDLTASGEVLNGATSLIGAINRLARATDASGQAGIKGYVVEDGVTITAGNVVAQGTVSGRVTQGNANANANGRFIGVALETGTGDGGGSVLVRVALPGNFISDSGASFTAGDACHGSNRHGRSPQACRMGALGDGVCSRPGPVCDSVMATKGNHDH